MSESELTFKEHEEAHAQTMETSDPAIGYFEVTVELSEYALEAFKAEGLRRKLDGLQATLESVAADLEVQRGRGNPRVTRYR